MWVCKYCMNLLVRNTWNIYVDVYDIWKIVAKMHSDAYPVNALIKKLGIRQAVFILCIHFQNFAHISKFQSESSKNCLEDAKGRLRRS